jgi:hypothetical protein
VFITGCSQIQSSLETSVVHGGQESIGAVLSEHFGFPLPVTILLMLHIKLQLMADTVSPFEITVPRN